MAVTDSILNKVLFFSIGCLAYTGAGIAEEVDPNFALVSAPVKKICQQVANAVVPAGDQPNQDLAKTLKNCDAASFYYGFNPPADAVKARQCAYATQNFPVLTMIYANGKGAQRNWDLAIHFACKAGFAPDEIEGRVLHLVQLRDKNWQGNDFDICTDVTSGYMMGVCASQQEKLANIHRQQQIAELTAGWNEADKKALMQLLQTANDFFTTHGANEVDLSGSDRVAAEIEEEGSLQDEFLSSLKDLVKGNIPNYSPDQAVNFDQALNKMYQQIEENKDFSVGTVDRLSVKKTQLEWLKYRDAWIEFGKMKFPQVSEDSWKAWLTEKRIKMLQDLADST